MPSASFDGIFSHGFNATLTVILSESCWRGLIRSHIHISNWRWCSSSLHSDYSTPTHISRPTSPFSLVNWTDERIKLLLFFFAAQHTLVGLYKHFLKTTGCCLDVTQLVMHFTIVLLGDIALLVANFLLPTYHCHATTSSRSQSSPSAK